MISRPRFTTTFVVCHGLNANNQITVSVIADSHREFKIRFPVLGISVCTTACTDRNRSLLDFHWRSLHDSAPLRGASDDVSREVFTAPHKAPEQLVTNCCSFLFPLFRLVSFSGTVVLFCNNPASTCLRTLQGIDGTNPNFSRSDRQHLQCLFRPNLPVLSDSILEEEREVEKTRYGACPQ